MRPIRTAALAATAVAIAAGPAGAQKPIPASHIGPLLETPTPNPELVYEPVAGCRVLDTHASTALTAPRSFTISGSGNLKAQGGPKGGCGVPVSATAVSIYLTASDAGQSGSVAAYPTGKPATHISAVSYASSLQLSSGGVVGINNHQLTLAPSAGSVQVAGDVTGYFAPQIEAYLLQDGSIYAGTTRVLSAAHLGTGLYNVTVDRDVLDCSVNATSGSGVGQIVASTNSGGLVNIYAYSLGGDLVDTQINVTVAC